MNRWAFISLLLSAGFFGPVAACQQTKGVEPTKPDLSLALEYQTTPYPWIKPANFTDPVCDLSKNPLTYEGVALGKTLFFDGMLSGEGTITCAFYHIPETGFAHTDHVLSHGIRDQLVPRNGLGLQNLAWNKAFVWDEGIYDLDMVPISLIQNPVEMGDTLPHVIAKVQRSAKYLALFKAAFGSDTITSERFLNALSQYLLTLVSAGSKYDKYKHQEAGEELSEQEL